MKLSRDHTTWEERLKIEAKPEDVKIILRYLFPYLRIKNVRKLNQRTDWTIYGNIDDKTDQSLGETGNITIDESTLKCKDKNLLLLYVNPKFPGYFLLIKNSLLDSDEIINNSLNWNMDTVEDNESYSTRCFIVSVESIKNAIIHSYPSIEWWYRRRTK